MILVKKLHKTLLLVASLVSIAQTPTATAQSLHNTAPMCALYRLDNEASLSSDQLTAVRESMLQINNEGRLNPNYRKAAGNKTALRLPADLTPLVLSKVLNEMAQEQAVYQASIKDVTHENRNYGSFGDRVKKHVSVMAAEACSEGPLSEHPTEWMKSETHYKPTWNLDGQTVNAVGFGVAKGSDGKWYHTAIWANLSNLENKPQAPPKVVQPNGGGESIADQGKIYKSDKLYSANRKFYASINNAGYFVVGDAQGNELWTTPKGGGDYLRKGRAGRLALFDKNDKWIHDIGLSVPGSIEVSNDGRLMQYDPCRTEVWSSPTPATSGTTSPGSNPGTRPSTPAPERPAPSTPSPVTRTEVVKSDSPNSGTVRPSSPQSGNGSVVQQGQKIQKGTKVYSPNKDYYLQINDAGSLVMSSADGTKVWSVGQGGQYFLHQASDGNFCLYDAKDKWKWGTQVYGADAARGSVRVENDGKLVQYKNNGVAAWSSSATLPNGEASIPTGMKVFADAKVYSSNKLHFLKINAKGALAIVDASNNEVWTAGAGGAYFVHQDDGNFCLYDKDDRWKWGTQKYGPNGSGGKVTLTDQGVLKQYDKQGKVVWSSR